MKKIYLTLILACLALISNAQVYETNFDESIDAEFLSITNDEFSVSQESSSLLITSLGHDEWSTVKYYFNDGENKSTIKMSASDTIYVKVKAEFGDTMPAPKVTFTVFDIAGTSPSNVSLRLVNSLTVRSEWQILKYVVPNWYDEDVTKSVPDTNQISGLVIAPNAGFGTYPFENADNVMINSPFVGKIYVDFIKIMGAGVSINGISDNKSKKALNLYPNPTSSSFSVQDNAKGGNYQLYNSAGVLLIEGKIESTQVDVSTLDTGLYFIQITKNNTVFTSSFVKQ